MITTQDQTMKIVEAQNRTLLALLKCKIGKLSDVFMIHLKVYSKLEIWKKVYFTFSIFLKYRSQMFSKRNFKTWSIYLQCFRDFSTARLIIKLFFFRPGRELISSSMQQIN